MLTLAAFWAPAQTGGAGFSLFAGHAGSARDDAGADDVAHNTAADDDFESDGTPCCGTHAAYSSHATYWPCDLLNAFILRMAATGHCVSAAMMLGDRDYAQEQLHLARGLHAEDLAALAGRLQAYFDAAATEGCLVAAALDEEDEGAVEPDRLLLV